MSKNSISKAERILLLSFSFAALAFFALGISAEVTQVYNNSVAEHQKELARQAGAENIPSFSVDHGPYHSIPLMNLILLPIFLSLLRARSYILSTSLTALLGVFLTLSIASRLDSGQLGTDPWHEIWINTMIYDYLAAFVIAVLLIWQCSILWRVFSHDRPNPVLK